MHHGLATACQRIVLGSATSPFVMALGSSHDLSRLPSEPRLPSPLFFTHVCISWRNASFSCSPPENYATEMGDWGDCP